MRNGDLAIDLPPQSLCEEVVDLYFRFIHDTFHSLFHRPTMMQDVSQGTVSPVILYAMISLSARSVVSVLLRRIDTALMTSVGFPIILSSLAPRIASEGEYMRMLVHSCLIYVISRCGPCKHVCYLVHSALSREKRPQKPSITVSPAALQCYSILLMRLRPPDWSRKSTGEVCNIVLDCAPEYHQLFAVANRNQSGGLFV
jgi:hypothetical protein